MRTLAAFAFLLTAGLLIAAEPPKGFTAIFNGKDLAGWHGWAIHGKGGSPADMEKAAPEERAKRIDEWTADAKKHWSVENGELVNDGHGAFLATDKPYGDFELLIDYRTVAKADSGIYLRATPQVQIWDFTDPSKFNLGADKGSGGLWNNDKGSPGKDPLVLADRRFGQWNSFRIVMTGERVSVWLNDKLVVDHARMENYWNRKLPLPKAAAILLQTHGGEIRWRNIFIREIPAAEANAILAKKANEGLKPLFNGKDMEGWTGAKDSYEIADGVLACKKGKGGVLMTKDKYADFVTTMQFKLPAGGNNGLGLRYPGGGDGAYVGMCELQILDDDAEKYKTLDARQYHGSAYGMVAAHRGYQRPVGEWNFQSVRVQGPKIQVELNGTRILNCDLSTVTEYMNNSKHPGKDLKEGYLGLLGHGDPVAFKDLMIKTLDSK